jgi:hypothetical protein
LITFTSFGIGIFGIMKWLKVENVSPSSPHSHSNSPS